MLQFFIHPAFLTTDSFTFNFWITLRWSPPTSSGEFHIQWKIQLCFQPLTVHNSQAPFQKPPKMPHTSRAEAACKLLLPKIHKDMEINTKLPRYSRWTWYLNGRLDIWWHCLTVPNSTYQAVPSNKNTSKATKSFPLLKSKFMLSETKLHDEGNGGSNQKFVRPIYKKSLDWTVSHDFVFFSLLSFSSPDVPSLM